MGRKLASVALLSLALFAFVGVGVVYAAYAQEYCVDGCIMGYTCPIEYPPGISFDSCIVLGPGEPEPTATIVEVEKGEATGVTTAVLSARIDSRHKGVRSLAWQYGTRAEDVGGGQTLVEPLEAPGSLDPHVNESVGEGIGGERVESRGGEDGAVEIFGGSGSLTSLEPDTTYFFRAVVTNGGGALEYGPTASFHTDPIPSEEAPSGSSGSGGGGSSESGEAPGGGSPPGSGGGGGTPGPSEVPVQGPQSADGPSVSIFAVPLASSGSTQHAASSGSAAAPNATNAAGTGTRARKLAKALRACRSKPRRARETCVRQAQRRFGEPHSRR